MINSLNSQAYLAKFYKGALDSGSKALLRFYATIYKELNGCSYLEFGGGPTIYSFITAARTAGFIHFTDNSIGALKEVEKWQSKQGDAFDWSYFTQYALQCEYGDDSIPDEQEIEIRHQLIRQRLQKISRCDAFADDPLMKESVGPYGVVANNFCLDCFTNDRELWLHFNKKVSDLVAPGGIFTTSSLLNASCWIVEDIIHPAVNLNLSDILDMYETFGFSVNYSEIVYLEERTEYDGFILVSGQKR